MKGGAYVYGNYPDIDALFAEQAAEMNGHQARGDPAPLQQLIHDKAIFAPIWQQAFISGIGRRSGNRASG